MSKANPDKSNQASEANGGAETGETRGAETGEVEGALDCPLRRVLAANQHGLIVESVRGFEIGSSMMLGCHVDALMGSVFISAETLVVESQQRPVPGRRAAADGEVAKHAGAEVESAAGTVYQVTLMFSEISAHDRELLGNLTHFGGVRLASRQVGQRSGLAIPPPQVLPINSGDESSRQVAAGASSEDASPGSVGDCSLN